jgi:hypothetical protein
VDRKAISVAGLAAVALLVAVAAFGCANRGAVQPAGHAPAVQSSQGDKAASTPTPTPVDPVTTDPANDPGATDAPDAAADSLAGDLSDLDRLLSGINGALSGSDPGPSGGE